MKQTSAAVAAAVSGWRQTRLAGLAAQVARFGTVGVAATLTHGLVLVALSEGLALDPVVGNLLAFSIAFGVSFAGQSRWVFRAGGFAFGHLWRFASTALLGLGLNFAIMKLTVDALGLHYLLGFAAVVASVPAITFLLNKLWVFQATPGGAAGREAAAQVGRRDAAEPARPQAVWLAAAAVVLLAAVPLLLTPVFPFVDFYSHVARYRVLAEIGEVPAFAANYEAAWGLLPNLGLDLIGVALMQALPPLLVAKLIVLLVFAAMVAGIWTLSSSLHGRLPLTAVLLTGIVLYSHILNWGFVNFLFGLGLTFLGVGLWLRTEARPGLQYLIAVPFAVALLFAHGLAFALYGLVLGMVELNGLALRRDLRPGAMAWRLLRLAGLAVVPAILFLDMPTSGAEQGATEAFENLEAHAERGALWERLWGEALERLESFLRVAETPLPALDYALGLALWGGLAWLVLRGTLRVHPRMWGAVGLAVLLVGLTPPNLFGVGYIDDRMPLLLFCLLAASLSLAGPSHRANLAVAALAGIFVLRLATIGAVWSDYGAVYAAYIDDSAQIPAGALTTSVLWGEGDGRDAHSPRCQPLRPVALLTAEAVVPLFANPTQQPLRLDGRLAEAVAAEPDPPPPSNPSEPGALSGELARAAAKGFEFAVVCGAEHAGPAQARLLAERPPYRLYRLE